MTTHIIEFIREGKSINHKPTCQRKLDEGIVGDQMGESKTTRHRHKIGVLLGVKADDRVVITWALCKKGEVFDMTAASVILGGRLATNHHRKIPQSIKKQADQFLIRCEKYFKCPAQFLPDGQRIKRHMTVEELPPLPVINFDDQKNEIQQLRLVETETTNK